MFGERNLGEGVSLFELEKSHRDDKNPLGFIIGGGNEKVSTPNCE